MKRFHLSIVFLIGISGCVTFAPPSPLMTFGGPKTTPKNVSEAGIAVGTGIALFDDAHAGAQGWFARYKYGISDKIDLGFDLSGAARNDGQYLAGKVASRYQLTDNSRIELGLGAGDDSDGKSLNGDIAITIGTVKDKPWNYYSSLRFSYAKGYPGNAIFGNQTPMPEDTIAPPNTSFLLLNLGSQGEITENQKIIFESGYGYIFPDGTEKGPAFYIAAGLLFYLGER